MILDFPKESMEWKKAIGFRFHETHEFKDSGRTKYVK